MHIVDPGDKEKPRTKRQKETGKTIKETFGLNLIVTYSELLSDF
jgi:hypothetical protein